MLRLHLSQGSGAAGVISANAVTSRCESGAPDSSLCHARFDDRKAAIAARSSCGSSGGSATVC